MNTMRLLSPKAILMILALSLSAGTAYSQGPPPQGEPRREFAAGDERPNLLQALGLSQDQVRQIRIMNRDRKPVMEEAQRRLREANQALDMAVYGDELNETDVRIRLKEFQDAQADVAKIRFQSELSLRKILTPDQLVRFRRLRQRMARARENMQQRRQDPADQRPLQQIRQLPRQTRDN